MIGQTISHYRIIRKLGEGGMGSVYVAEDTALGREVAIKTLNDGGPGKQHFRTRFLREARAVSTFSHQYIAAIYDYGETEKGQPFIVMELVKGETLSELIAREVLTIPQVIEIVVQVAKALAEAHRHGIVHRDIKPSNIAVNDQGDVKVLDFGLAKHLSEGAAQLGEPSINEDVHSDTRHDGNSDLNHGHPDAPAHVLPATRTREGVILCTPEYASPEQAMGIEVDARTDLFSLGSVLYECLTGRRPFSGSSPNDVRVRVIRDDPPPPSRINSLVPAELDRITLKALAKKPEARYQTAEELLADLLAAKESWQQNGAVQQLHYPTRIAESTSPLNVPQTHGLSTITVAFTKSRIPVLYVIIAAVMLALMSWVAWRLLRTKPYQPAAAAQRWYDEGIHALHDGTYYKASKMFEEAVKQDDKFALAHARLAEAWAELGYFEKASAEISQANLLINNASPARIDTLYVQAMNATVSHDFNGALESYRQMVPLVQVADRPHLFVDLGRAYEKNEDLPKAIANYREAIKSESEYAPAFLREAILSGRLQEIGAAEAALDKAFALYEIQSNPEGMAEVLYQRGVLFTSRDMKKAREPLERALNIARTFSNPSQETKTLLQLSSVNRLNGDTETAKKYASEALDLAETNGLSDLKTQSLTELGYVFFYRSEIAGAEKYFKQALERAQADRVRVSEARAQFALGSMHIQQDEADEGIPFIKQALPFYEQNVYRREIMQCQTLLGQAYALKGDLLEALKAFETQLRLAQDLNNQLQIGLSQKSISTVLGNQEKYPEALVRIEQSYSTFNSLGNQLYVGYSLISKADMLWRLGQYDDAQAALNLATSLAEQPDGKFKQLWGRLYVVSAPMALSQKNFAVAITNAEQAIKLDTSRTKHPAIEAGYTLGLAQFLSGDKLKGKQTCEQAVQAANAAGDPRLLMGALLALAEVMIEASDARGAFTNALKAQQLADQSHQIESEWRALLIAGRANERLGDYKSARENLLRADSLLSSLQQRWGGEHFNSYLLRPDVVHYTHQLKEASAMSAGQ